MTQPRSSPAITPQSPGGQAGGSQGQGSQAQGGQTQGGQAQGNQPPGGQADLTAPDDQSPEMNRPQLSEADKTFLVKAYAGSLSDVQLGQLAVQKGTNMRTKQFGTRMAAEHDQASQVLTQIASEADVELPTQPERMATSTYQRLRGIPGSDFDAAFAQAVLQAHQREIIEFRQQAKSGKDPALKDFAQKSLPMLQQHLMMARSLLAPSG